MKIIVLSALQFFTFYSFDSQASSVKSQSRQVNSTGNSVEEGIKRIGGDPKKIRDVARKKGDLAAFLELHIEQGGILDSEEIEIGIVEGIVGIKWWDVILY